MKARLILLDTPIIVSDEEIKEGDKILSPTYEIQTCIGFETGIGSDLICWIKVKETTTLQQILNSEKIIAGIPELPSIDFNGLEEKFGIVDVEKIFPTNKKGSMWMPNAHEVTNQYRQEGFRKAQSLNEKKYSLGDMYEFQKFVDRTKPSYKKQQEFIQSLSQPKIFDIEIEMKRERLYTNDGLDYEGDLNPKITNKKIKIIKVLKTKH